MTLSIFQLAALVFQYMSQRDLLRGCSLVNSTWQRNARLVLRRDRIFVAQIYDEDRNRTFTKFASLMTTSRAVPFNGISLYYNCYECKERCDEESKAVDTILQIPTLTIKYLKYRSIHTTSGCRNSNIFARLSKIWSS